MFAAGLKVKPFVAKIPKTRSEVAMAELDPRTNTKDRVELMGEVQPFLLGREDRFTLVGRNLGEKSVRRIGQWLNENKDLLSWAAADMPGIHPYMISHKLSLFKDAPPVS